MAWSTRELADLAGTTVNTIRHYHRLGLLEEPERRGNGYKQYGVQDFVRLLRIRRLVDLGVPLARIRVDAAEDHMLLRQVDADLTAELQRLRKMRSGIAVILRDGAFVEPNRSDEAGPVDPEFDALSADADEESRQRLAEKLTPSLVRHLADHPWLSDPATRLAASPHLTRQTLVDAVVELYNPAQLDVLVRAGDLARQQLTASAPAR
ncbi:MerR family transcriptional regulator [Actinoplanes sp. TRM 88003]|uniref:MerR family transcriptional regulator n=1 Tax=Paractinoplanes aksuensis TaxID=2939490 RepID=A0ABT1E2A0_9ACTN|nr:MerR family transcriptional regulator [Actinoplanes aksuensis]MCO8276265.1 MerR family transcriptional regulator [Actinoplanes aksuensis]